MSEMVERVAKAFQTFSVGGYDNHWNICRRDTATGDFVEVVEVRSGSYADACIYCNEMNARAAIAAMREPTEAMMEAGNPYADDNAVWRAWRAMIDITLKK